VGRQGNRMNKSDRKKFSAVMSGFVPQPDQRDCRLGIEIEIQIEIVIRGRVGQFDFDTDFDFDND
jgi:hypothetical protein